MVLPGEKSDFVLFFFINMSSFKLMQNKSPKYSRVSCVVSFKFWGDYENFLEMSECNKSENP